MINLFEFSSSQEYLYTPETWLHKITSKVKIISMILYLLCLPITSIHLLFLINCCLIILSFTLFIPNLFFYHLYKQFFSFFIALFILCISFNEVNNKNLVKMNYTFNIITYSYKYRFVNKILLFNKNLVYQKYKVIFYIEVSVSLQILRFFFIMLSFVSMHKLLVTTTENRDILFAYTKFFLQFLPFIETDIIFILILSSECIYLFEKRIKNIQMSISLKGKRIFLSNYDLKIINLYIISINMLCKIIFMDIQTISIALYSREIFPHKQRIWLLK